MQMKEFDTYDMKKNQLWKSEENLDKGELEALREEIQNLKEGFEAERNVLWKKIEVQSKEIEKLSSKVKRYQDRRHDSFTLLKAQHSNSPLPSEENEDCASMNRSLVNIDRGFNINFDSEAEDIDLWLGQSMMTSANENFMDNAEY